MVSTNIYLNFDGQAEEAFNFYKSIFGTEFTALQRMKDTLEAGKLAPEEQELIMHIALPLGDNSILMASDCIGSFGHQLIVGNNFSISVQAESKEEADKLYHRLSDGGNQGMPMEEMFWGDYFGALTDKFGIQWMVNYPLKA